MAAAGGGEEPLLISPFAEQQLAIAPLLIASTQQAQQLRLCVRKAGPGMQGSRAQAPALPACGMGAD